MITDLEIDVPEAFLKNLDDGTIKEPTSLESWTEYGGYNVVIKFGKVDMSVRQAFLLPSSESEVPLSSTSVLQDGFGGIVWVDEPEGYRIATFCYGAWGADLKGLEMLIEESIAAIEKQRDLRRSLLAQIGVDSELPTTEEGHDD